VNLDKMLMRCAVFAAALLAGAPAALAQLNVSAEEWSKIVAAAKQEGQVTVWGEAGAPRRAFWKDAFEKANPGIKVELFQASRNAERDARYQRELQAGLAKVDVFVGGSAGAWGLLQPQGILQPMKPFLRPQILDPKVWLLGDTLWLDKDRQYMLISDYLAVPAVTVNAAVGEGDLKSWDDLLDPKYDGKIVMLDPRSSGLGFSTSLFFYYSENLGPDFLARLYAHGRVVFSPDERQNVDWLDSGKMLVGISANPVQVAQLQALGSKIRAVYSLTAKGKLVGNVSSTDGILFLPKLGADPLPHPHAMEVYVDWFYSKAGQQAMADSLGTPSYRNDVDLSRISPLALRKSGVDYMNMNAESLVAGASIAKMRAAVAAALNAPQ
jgi:iron(III) transport system substrate-binding protein